jgi:3-hydroxybutyryl-CoA dehydratase
VSEPAIAPPAGGFDALAVGSAFRSRGRTITEADVVGFSALTGDWHPQHADAEWAAASHFGERIAHGLLVVSFALGLIDFDPERLVALRRLERTTFKRPVRIGDTLRVEGRITAVRPIDARFGLVSIACKVRAAGATAVGFTAEVVWRRDADATEGGGEP